MVFKTCLMLILLMSMSGTGVAATPRYATDLQSYDASAKVEDKMIRMRISAASETSFQAQKLVAVGDILLCGAGSCYRARAAGNTAIGDTARGSATVLSDVVIPRTTITDVYFSEPPAAIGLSGHLKLPAPLVIEQNMQGIELFITVRKQVIGQRTHFIPAQFASMYFNPESELVHYVPSTATVAALSRGATLGIPAGALPHPQIFHIGVLDTGETFPKIDIYPYIELGKAATVEAKALRAAVDTDELIVPVHPAAPDGALASAPAAASGPASRITLKRTAVIEPAALEQARSSARKQTDPQGQPQAAGSAKTCAEYLAQPVVFTLLDAMLLQTGAVRIKACENIKPNVHMVYVNTGDKRIRFSLPYRLSTTGSGHAPQLRLQRINEFAPFAIAMINGFTWEGDYGLVDGGSGAAEGIVRSAGFTLGDNVVGGGKACSGCAVDSFQLVMGFSTDLARPGFFYTRSPSAIGAYSFNTVSSSTSVVKNGSCQTPGTVGRWSAVGAANGRMLLISSTSNGQTSAAELCPVFKALVIKNALRLDGGPSAAIMVSGQVLNELTGLDRLK